jgi:hypothetical protein
LKNTVFILTSGILEIQGVTLFPPNDFLALTWPVFNLTIRPWTYYSWKGGTFIKLLSCPNLVGFGHSKLKQRFVYFIKKDNQLQSSQDRRIYVWKHFPSGYSLSMIRHIQFTNHFWMSHGFKQRYLSTPGKCYFQVALQKASPQVSIAIVAWPLCNYETPGKHTPTTSEKRWHADVSNILAVTFWNCPSTIADK